MSAIDSRVLKSLALLDTPTICNAIELFDVRPRDTGFLDDRIRACFPGMLPMVGFASTATLRTSAPPADGDSCPSMADHVERFGELSGPVVPIFQDLDDPPVGATFGEVMCTVYKAFGAVGLVTSGAGRDLDQVRSLDFPVFTNGTVCAHGYWHILDLHVPVHVGGVVIYPDDLIHGDLNGLTTIPREIVSELADVAAEFAAAEAIILDAVRVGRRSSRLLREAEAECRARIAKLRAEVSRAK